MILDGDNASSGRARRCGRRATTRAAPVTTALLPQRKMNASVAVWIGRVGHHSCDER